ncbi:hypothetical protein PBAL39_20254 [Pedobacter sp. BAL39]|uniref:hypothetical protein n=1 Tax=Pedobacter sp. BAL39 TaxID=391596 RepID=UPI0001559A1E|nr:hypothetical protein [Pedobacter sp. BAL39]EDM36252.1 hypothetical protein PBAL39_20254 [Pedobacter sp. BAL39]
MYELSKGMATIHIPIFEDFESTFILELQRDLVSVMDMIQMARKTSDLDDYPQGNMESIFQLYRALMPTREEIEETHPFIEDL